MMKRGDRVEIRRGTWKGYTAQVTQVIGNRVGVNLNSPTFAVSFSLAASSVRKLEQEIES